MSSFQPFLFFMITIFFSFQSSISLEICRTRFGSRTIRFPFKLIDQPQHCGYQGFELHWIQDQDLLILNLPHAGNFTVNRIDYVRQTLQLSTPEGCIQRILLQGLNLSGVPFMTPYTQSFTFYNCSTTPSTHAIMMQYHGVEIIPCLSELNFDVVAIPTTTDVAPSMCTEIATVTVPVSVSGLWEDGITLGWNEPDCRWCESHEGTCLLENVGAGLVGCDGAKKSGLSTRVKYGLLFGLGAPLVCLIAIVSCTRINLTERPNHPDDDILMTSTTLPRPTTAAANGLDRRTIDAYPTTSLGPSRLVPNPDDNVCSICLCEYQADEMLRTIPTCNHYFHVDCIDHWLKLNATCPICRD